MVCPLDSPCVQVSKPVDGAGNGFTHDHLASLKEACVLAMLRLSNECEEVPEEVIERVKKVAETAGKFLRRVCWFSVVADISLMYSPL